MQLKQKFYPCAVEGCPCKFPSIGPAREHLAIFYHCPECNVPTGDLNTDRRKAIQPFCQSCSYEAVQEIYRKGMKNHE